MKQAIIEFLKYNESENANLAQIQDLLDIASERELSEFGGIINEITSVLRKEELTFSNEYRFNTIIQMVKSYTKDSNLLNILNNIYIGFVENPEENKVMEAYTPVKFDDNSILVILNKKLHNTIEIIADMIASKYMLDYRGENVVEVYLHQEICKISRSNILENTSNDLNSLLYNLASEEYVDKFVAFSNEISEVALAMIIGHEIGHHYFKHLDDEKRLNLINNKELYDDFSKLSKYQIEEVEADIFSLKFAVDFLHKYYPKGIKKHQLTGLLIMPVCLALESSNPTISYETHPSERIRLMVLEEVMKNFMENETILISKIDIDWLCNKLNIWNKNHWWKE